MLYIHNETQAVKYYRGVPVGVASYLLVTEDKLIAYRTSEDLLADLASGEAAVSNDTTTKLTGSAGLGLLNNVNPTVSIIQSPAFSAKITNDGLSLYRRVHGVKKALSGDTIFDIVVPYNQCKINEIEILWAPAGLQADLKVYDTPAGAISSVPNYMLNQFGFDAGVAKDFYQEYSSYDADLIKDMKVEVTLKNPNSSTDVVCVNFVLHELK